jgi:hypothetical protein
MFMGVQRRLAWLCSVGLLLRVVLAQGQELQGSATKAEAGVTVQVGVWGRPPVCRLAGPLARSFDAIRFTEPEAP